jgi:kinesin family protein 2/24
MEEFTGKVAIKNLTEHLVRNQQEFQSIISMLFESRRSQSTKRNDQSSRSHALFRLRFARPPSLKGIAIEDGLLWMVDLAGSENANDSSQHDQLLFEQTKLINQSLMCLRDCIRAREMLLAPGNTTSAPAKHVHIPFRQSPLTFLLREVFDPHIALRPIRTLAIGCITPLNCDASQSRSTLRYMETLWKTRSRCSGRRDCTTAEERFTTVPYDPMNPVTWAADKLAGWIIQTTGGLIEPHDLMRNDCQTGLDILRLPEQEFIERCMQANPRLMTEKRAKAFYMKLWKLGADQRRRQQKERMKPRPPKQNNETPPTPLTQNNEPS